jgi:hypothetical protein
MFRRMRAEELCEIVLGLMQRVSIALRPHEVIPVELEFDEATDLLCLRLAEDPEYDLGKADLESLRVLFARLSALMLEHLPHPDRVVGEVRADATREELVAGTLARIAGMRVPHESTH